MPRRTTKDYLDLMEHGLGKTPATGHKLIDTLNDAGRALMTLHQWGWRIAPSTFLPVTVGQSWVDLPDDFGQVLSLEGFGSRGLTVKQTSIAHIQRLRSSTIYDQAVTWISFEASDLPVTDESGQRHKRAEIWPTPTEDTPDIQFSYRRAWFELDENDTTRVPAIPIEYERALLLLARAYALGVEDQVEADETRQAQAEIDRLIREDAGRQVNMGQPLHSVRTAGMTYQYPHHPVTGP